MFKNKGLFLLVLIMILSNLTIIEGNKEIEDNSGINLRKQAYYDEKNNKIDITLETFVESRKNESKRYKPLDVIFVVDQSSSMDEYLVETKKTYENILNFTGINDTDSMYTYRESLYYWKNNRYEKINVEYMGSYFNIVLNEEIIMELPRFTAISEFNENEIMENMFLLSTEKIYHDMRINIVKDVITNISEELVEHGENYDLDHRISILGFSTGGYPGDNYYGSEVLTAPTQLNDEKARFKEKGQENYQYYKKYLENSLVDVSTVYNNNELGGVAHAISKISLRSSTHTVVGMEMARQLVEYEKKNSIDRNQVVIVLTDGEPNGTFYEINKDLISAGNPAIQVSNEIKKHDVPVYTIGIYDERDVSNDSLIDRFMSLLSSNFHYRRDLSENIIESDYEEDENGYFRLIDNPHSLEEYLSQVIETELIPNLPDAQNYRIVDYVADEFQLTKENANVTVGKQLFEGYDENGIEMWSKEIQDITNEVNFIIDEEKNSIKITNYDFKDEFIGEKDGISFGSKLIVRFSANILPGFIGGNDINTNRHKSGFYIDENLVKEYEFPKVSIPIKFDINSKDHSIYLSNDFELDDLIYKDESFKYKIGDSEFELDGINNSYVDIKLNIMHDEVIIWEHIIAAGDVFDYEKIERDLNKFGDNTNFKINYEVISINDQDVKLSNQLDSTVYVLKPDIKSKNTESYLGEKMIFSDNFALNNIVWLAGDSGDNAPDPQEKYVKPNLDINIPEIKDFDLNQQYYWQEDKSFSYEVLLNGDNSFNKYIIPKDKIVKHKIIPVSLIVEKNVNKFRTDDNFRFKIKWLGTDGSYPFNNVYDMNVFLKGNEQIEISGLPIGKYEVVEDTKWSWRYEAVGEVSQVKEILNDKRDYKFSFQNKLTNKKHLGKEVIINNRYE